MILINLIKDRVTYVTHLITEKILNQNLMCVYFLFEMLILRPTHLDKLPVFF